MRYALDGNMTTYTIDGNMMYTRLATIPADELVAKFRAVGIWFTVAVEPKPRGPSGEPAQPAGTVTARNVLAPVPAALLDVLVARAGEIGAEVYGQPEDGPDDGGRDVVLVAPHQALFPPQAAAGRATAPQERRTPWIPRAPRDF